VIRSVWTVESDVDFSASQALQMHLIEYVVHPWDVAPHPRSHVSFREVDDDDAFALPSRWFWKRREPMRHRVRLG
jgi:hypothetical protein